MGAVPEMVAYRRFGEPAPGPSCERIRPAGRRAWGSSLSAMRGAGPNARAPAILHAAWATTRPNKTQSSELLPRWLLWTPTATSAAASSPGRVLPSLPMHAGTHLPCNSGVERLRFGRRSQEDAEFQAAARLAARLVPICCLTGTREDCRQQVLSRSDGLPVNGARGLLR